MADAIHNVYMCMLLQVMFAMNCKKSATTQNSTYHLMFGIAPQSYLSTESRLLDEASDIDDVGASTAPSSAVSIS